MSSKPLAAARELAALKARLAGSAAERAAIDAVGRWFEARGEAVRYEGFVASTSPPLNAALHLWIAALAALLGGVWAPAGLALLILALASAVRELRGDAPWLRRLLPRDSSYNLLVRRPASGRRLGTLVLAAQVDVPRRTWRLSRALVAAPLGLAAGLALVLALESLGLGWFWLAPARWIAAVALAAGGLAALYQHGRPAREGPGPGDSGVAAVLEAGELLAAQPLEHLDLELVIAGSQEAHGGGIRALLRQERARWSPADTALIFVEDLGEGELVYGVGERLLTTAAYRPTLPALAERISRRRPWRGVGGAVLPRFTGALLPTRAGYRAMTVSGAPPSPAVSPPSTRRCAAFLAELARVYDADLSEEVP